MELMYSDFDWKVTLGFVVQILLSLLCGALLGSEREIRKHPAGLRTIMLIAVGSCAFMVAGTVIAEQMQWSSDRVRIDPGRLPSYVIAGIGFLGAGPIIAHHGQVHGLTTAATIWVAAAVGILIGAERFLLGVALTTLVISVLFLARPLSQWLYRRGRWVSMTVICPPDLLLCRFVLNTLIQHSAEIDGIDEGEEAVKIRFRYRFHPRENAELLRELRNIDSLRAEGEEIWTDGAVA